MLKVRRILAALLLSGTAFLCQGDCTQAQTAGQPPGRMLPGAGLPMLPLTVVPSASTQVIYNEATFDFGEADACDGTITHGFALKNQSNVPLVIDRLQTSCGCTTTAIAGQPPGVTVALIRPGQTITVYVSINASVLYPGTVAKTVGVYIQGQAAPTLTLNLNGILSPSIAISPEIVQFGPVKAGAANHAVVTIDVDERLVSSGTKLVLTCPSRDITVSRLSRILGVHNRRTLIQEIYEVDYRPRTAVDVLQSSLSITLFKDGVVQPLPPGNFSSFVVGAGA